MRTKPMRGGAGLAIALLLLTAGAGTARAVGGPVVSPDNQGG